MSNIKAIFPGSFDPFTRGHEAMVHTSLGLFDEVVVAIGVNSGKSYLFSVQQRIDFISRIFKKYGERVKVLTYEGLTVDFCTKNGINVIIRGLRNSRDFEFEYEIASMNRALRSGVETIFLASRPEFSAINSTIVREIYRNGGDTSPFLPEGFSLP